MGLALISYKDSRLKCLFSFQVWARFFCRSLYFCFHIFHTSCMNVSHAILDVIKHFPQKEPEHYCVIILILQAGDFKFASGEYISRYRVTEDANCQRPPCTVIYMNKWLVLYDLGWQLCWARFLLHSLGKKCLIYCTTCFNNNIFFKEVSEQ